MVYGYGSKLMNNTIIATTKHKEREFDMCSCSQCDWEGKISECVEEEESEGWEYPSYTIHLCPNCDNSEGGIEDYYYSKTNREIIISVFRKLKMSREEKEGYVYSDRKRDKIRYTR